MHIQGDEIACTVPGAAEVVATPAAATPSRRTRTPAPGRSRRMAPTLGSAGAVGQGRLKGTNMAAPLTRSQATENTLAEAVLEGE